MERGLVHSMPVSKEYSEEKSINWYPGHMLKAKKELSAHLKQVDVVLELRDARIPLASINKDFESLLQQKKRIILLNKTGLADEAVTGQWKAHFQQHEIVCHFIDVKNNQGVPKILSMARSMMQEKWQRFRKKGIRPPALKLLVAGIPNVGKSSLINKMAKRHAAATG
ncbi:MAG: 50S ribosome-binding GTPase, partial [SAR324 cluster bacterium]|nr:50S ribosome-binding GTPase [SAR324 cluster bacterium]